jgi:hypothetical protein
MRRIAVGVAAAVSVLSHGAALAGDDYADAFVRYLSAPDCVDARNFVAEFDPAPTNATYMRVQHIGDAGTAELAGEVANAVTWDVGQYTGFSMPPSSFADRQRGYRDQGPPNPASAFQLACGGGFFIDSSTFSHTLPLVLEGPSASIARDLAPPASVFSNGTSALTIEATIRVPYARFEGLPAIDGTAQVSFVYYVKDTITGTPFAHVVTLYDNRVAGTNGAGTEAVSADAYTAFVVSPLAAQTADGSPTQFVTAGIGSGTMQFVAPWSDARRFRVLVTYSQFKSMLDRLIRDALPSISPRPEDYRVTLFGVLGEIFPGTGTTHEVALAGDVTDLALAETYYPVSAVSVIEYYNAVLDHYFISARNEDILALDGGQLPGWRRTGETFGAWPIYADGASPVCRYYIPPTAGDSHFFSASAAECRDVASKFPFFVLEDSEVMFMPLPVAATGTCPADTTPVYRVWNGRADTNHRYTTSPVTRDAMIASGWIAEGYGPDGVAMCSVRVATSAAKK